MTRYVERQYRRAGIDDWTNAPREPVGEAQTITFESLTPGVAYDVRFRHVDDDGAAGPWTLRSAVLPEVEDTTPPTPQDLRLEGGCFAWTMPEDESVVGYLVRSHPGQNAHWSSGEPAHDALTTSPMLPLCGVPSGPRTLMVRAVDVNGNESETAQIRTDRAPQSPVLEHVVQERDAVTEGWAGTLINCSTVGNELHGDAIVGDAPMWSEDNEPMWLTDDTPMFRGDEHPMHYRFVGDQLPMWSADDQTPMWGTRYHDLVYVTGISACLGDPSAIVTVDVATDAPIWRLYWRSCDAPMWSDNDQSPMWDADDQVPMWAPKPQWRLWSGSLQMRRPAAVEFLVWVPGHRAKPVLTGMTIQLSIAGKTHVVSGLQVPVGGTRVALPGAWHRVLHADPVVREPQAGPSPGRSRVVDLNGLSGPRVAIVNDSDESIAGAVDVVVHGY